MSELISKEKAISVILGQPPEPHYPTWYADQIRQIPPDTREDKLDTLIEALQSEHKRLTEAQEKMKPRTGKWIWDAWGDVICSECGKNRRDNRTEHIGWCNACGAKMMEGDAE